AYAALGVTREDVGRQPVITPQLRKLASALAEMGQTMPQTSASPEQAMLAGSPVYYLQASDSPEARQVLDAYYSVCRAHRKALPLEAFCLAAGVPTTRIFEII